MTQNQIKALRGMLACKLYKTDAIEAGVDACRSDTYRAKLAQFKAEQAACLDWHKRREMKPPRAESVKGATELREWLSAEYDRVMILREKRAKSKDQAGLFALRQRCLFKIQGAVQEAYNKCDYRVSQSGWAGGEHEVKIKADSCMPNAGGYTERVWSSNGKWAGTNSTHNIYVMTSWYKRVYKKGIACVDGILTLDARPYTLPDLKPGEEALEATWVVQGRGVTLHPEEGILYRKHGGEWVHSNTVGGARRLHNNRIKSKVQERIERANRRARVAEEMESLATLVVTREDCKAAGLCDAGQRDWLAKRGLGEDTFAVPASKLLEMAVAANDRVDYVRRAIRLAASKTASVAA